MESWRVTREMADGRYPLPEVGREGTQPSGGSGLRLKKATEFGGQEAMGPVEVSSQVTGMKAAPAYEFLSSGLALSLSTCHILYILFTFFCCWIPPTWLGKLQEDRRFHLS